MSDAFASKPLLIKTLTAEDREYGRRAVQALQDRTEIHCVFDGDGYFVDVTGAWEAITGYPPGSLVGKHFSMLVAAEDLHESMEVVKTLKRDGERAAFTNRYRRADGSVRHILWCGVWSAEKALGFASGRDISKLSDATALLKTHGALLQMAGKVAQFGGWSLDLDSNHLEWSDEIYAILDHPTGQPPLSFANSMALFSSKSQQAIEEMLARCRSEGSDFDLEVRMNTLTQRRINVRMTGRCELDNDGKPIRVIGAIQDITHQKRAQYDIEKLAYFDRLTGLANRQQLLDKIDAQRSVCSRRQQHAALLSVNIDGFKVFNNSRGHLAGDQLLMLVGQRLSTSARDVDLVARTDGDNFVVLLRDLDRDAERAAAQTRNMATRIMAAVAEVYRLGDGRQHRLTTSIGIVMFGMFARMPDVLLLQSELAMQAVKAGGGQAIRFFDPALQSSVNNRAEMESSLRNAIDTADLRLHFEPQITANGNVVAVETLLRWKHPSLGMISPADFIPLAETSGLIIPLGRHVLKQACNWLVQWRSNPLMANLRMSVNISAAEFRHADFVEQTLAIVADSGVDPQWLTLELTESLLLTDISQVIERMHRLKAHGLRFALDDFGTGYSSLAYLQQLPLDQLKLDMSFVSKLPGDERSAAIVRTIIALGRNLGLELIAEGVETEAQRQFLLAEGCQCFQGHLFTPSQAAEDLARWLRTRH